MQHPFKNSVLSTTRTEHERASPARSVWLALVAASLMIGGCAADAEAEHEEELVGESQDAWSNPLYNQSVTGPPTRNQRGGDEVLCGESRNTSPFRTTSTVILSFTASVSLTGTLNATAVKDMLSANFGVNFTAAVMKANTITVEVPPGKEVKIYCYATGDYYSGIQTHRLTGAKSRFTAFIPLSVGTRVSYK
jgi:hypothetical protein